MKLIYLELEEEITSVIDKVGKISDNSITLVVPKGANLIQSIVNLKLLRKHAEMEGKEITVVTSDQVGVNLAKRAGLAAQQRVQHGDEEGDEPEPVPKSRITSYKEIEKAGVGIKKPVKTSPPAKKKGKAKSVSLLPKQKLLITIIVILVILVGGGAFAYFYLPKADINIVLNTETITNDVEVEILTSATELDEETNVIPGKRYEAEVSGEIEREATE